MKIKKYFIKIKKNKINYLKVNLGILYNYKIIIHFFKYKKKVVFYNIGNLHLYYLLNYLAI